MCSLGQIAHCIVAVAPAGIQGVGVWGDAVEGVYRYWVALPLGSMMTVCLPRSKCLLLGFATLNSAYMAFVGGPKGCPYSYRQEYNYDFLYRPYLTYL
jgi:hypothetical protein